MSALHLEFFGASLVCLAFGVTFSTLYHAYLLSGEAGLHRLVDKHPAREHCIRSWEPRWPFLCNELLILSVVLEMGAIVLAVTSIPPAAGIQAWILGLAFFFAIGFFILATHILPQALSETHADLITVSTLPWASKVAWIAAPLAWPLGRVQARLVNTLEEEADEEDRPTSEEEILSLVDQADGEELEEEEREIIRSVLNFGETVTREIMTPRVHVKGMNSERTVREGIDAIRESPFSRFPVFDDTIDHVRGILHVKDLLGAVEEHQQAQPVTDLVKEVPFVPETMPIDDLLRMMQARRAQMAVVVDEYGGTAGLVTLEDIIEELVGEIHDEYDLREPWITPLEDGSAILDARVPVEEANEHFDTAIPESEEYDSIGGYIFQRLGRVPRPGESLETDTFSLTIHAANANRIHTIRIDRRPAVDEKAGS